MILKIVLLVLTAVFIAVVFLRRRGRRQEKQYQRDVKLRNDRLDERLKHIAAETGKGESCRPYEVNYYPISKRKSGAQADLFQLTEKSEMAERKYLFSKNETVCIGNRGGETALLKEGSPEKAVCKIYGSQNHICIKASGIAPVLLQRGKQQTEVRLDGIILKDKDCIRILNSEFLFQYF